MRRVLLLMLAAGCRQVFGLDSPDLRDGGADVMADGRDAQGGTCLDRWMQGPQFASASPLMDINTPTQDRAPFVTADGARLYYVHDSDFYSASKTNGAFAMAMPEPVLTSGNNDNKIYVASNELYAVLSSNRNGGSGGTDLWRATRATSGSPWAIDQMFLDNLNAAGDQSDPFLSDDLLRIYYSTKGMDGRDVIMFAERSSPNDLFKPPSMIANLPATSANDEQPTLSGDETLIVFTSTRSGNRDLWYAMRADVSAPFDAPRPVDGINLPTRTDETAHLSPDACTVYFASDRGGSMDLYVTTLLD